MLKIKLARFGKKNQPHFRIVINEAREKRDGRYVENIGHYSPAQQPKILEIDKDRYQYWIEKGAIPTETVAALFVRFSSGNPFPAKKKQLSKKAQAKVEADKQTKQEAKASAAETKVEETVAAPVEAKTEEVKETEAPAQEAAKE